MLHYLKQRFSSRNFKEQSGAGAFFLSIVIWGIGVGCFAASINNFLAEVLSANEFQRGWIEFFRELPGFMLVFILAFLSRATEWSIMRLGILVSMAGIAFLLFPSDIRIATVIIMIWSTGEHVVMPVRSSIAMHMAKRGREGHSLGFLASAMNLGTVVGSVIVAAIFWTGTGLFGVEDRRLLYDVVFVLIFVLLAASLICSTTKNAPRFASKRPRLYFNRRFGKFYGLELFYGARKQIFLTFAPYVLIMEYGVSTGEIAMLYGVCAAVNIFAGPLIGKIADKFGYRNVMIYDTVILFFVCLGYGYAGDIFPPYLAVPFLYLNFLCDSTISTTSMATGMYAKDVAANRDELTASLSSGISINHMVSICVAPLGGWVWMNYGVAFLFTFAALMAAANSLFALTIPDPRRSKRAAQK